MKQLMTIYVNSFKGLSKEIWLLALITFINRAGTMVIPFLSLYLKKDLGFGYNEVGFIMMFFGIGSVVGTFLGGQFSDKFGFYPILFWSLFTSGFVFITLQYFQSFWMLCAGTFVLTLIADMFRPAIFVAIATYSKPGNETRSLTLIRLAINLGFSIGPAMGGVIIEIFNYKSLFWIDGITCILGALLIPVLLDRKNAKELSEDANKNAVKASPYSDLRYLLFFLATLLMFIAFSQYFTTVQLFYEEIIKLTPKSIGYLFFLNGFLIAATEMPLIAKLEKSKSGIIHLINWGFFLIAFSFLVLTLGNWVIFPIVAMLLVTIGEMIAFPFTNAFALDRAKNKNKGAYMALYSMAFSLAHIVAPIIGTQTVDRYGYHINWYLMIVFLGIGMLIMLGLKHTRKAV